MNGSVHAISDVDALWDSETGHAELAKTLFGEGLAEDGVECGSGVRAETEKDFDVCLDVPHCELDYAAGEGPEGAVAGGRVEGTARELDEEVFLETAGGGVVEVEVGGGGSREGGE